MAPKRATLEKSTKSSTRDAIEKTLVDLTVYANTQLFIGKESTLTWQQVNEALLSKSHEVDLEDKSRSNTSRKK